MNEKKSAVDLTDMAIGLVILGIVVTIGALVLTNLRDNRLTDLSTVATSNETLTTVTEKGEILSYKWVKSVDACINSTDAVKIASANYSTSISSVDGAAKVSFATGGTATFNNTNWGCNYTWYNTSSRPDYALASDAATGIAEYGNWFDIIVIVGIAGLVLALIFLAFGRDSGTGYSGGVGY